jgi:hypothetical protein
MSSFYTFEWPAPAIVNVDIVPAEDNEDDSMAFPFVADDDNDSEMK